MADYRSENAASLTRLFALLDGLNTSKLAHPLPNGWTVADALVHLAFWDAYSLDLLHGWQKGDLPQKSANIDATNAAVLSLSRHLPLNAIAPLVRNNATAVDQTVEHLNPVLAASIDASEFRFLLFRSWHREAHLKTLESELR
jgi:hypothetical protein